MASYQFNQDDQLFPVYCTKCRQHIPKVISNLHRGLCIDCANAQHVAAQRAAKQSQAATAPCHSPVPQTQAVLNDPRYQLNTGLNLSCPTCGSTNILLLGKEAQTRSHWGDAEWVAFNAVLDTVEAKHQKDRFQCAYCQKVFVKNEPSIGQTAITQTKAQRILLALLIFVVWMAFLYFAFSAMGSNRR